MAFIDDLGKAVSIFNDGMSQLATTQAFDKATKQINQLQTDIVDEQERRKAAQQISQQLTQDLLQAGAPVSKIQLAATAFGAPPSPSAEQLIREGDVTKGQELQKAQAFIPEKLLEARKRRDFDRQKDLLALKQSAQSNKLKTIPVGELKMIGERDDEIALGKQLLGRLNVDPGLVAPIAGRIPGGAATRAIFDPEFAAFKADVGRWFDIYRKRITGAQASVQEINILQKNIPNIEDPPNIFRAKIKSLLSIGRAQRARQLQKLKKAKFDIGLLAEEDSASKVQDTGKSPITPSTPSPSANIPGLEF